MSEAGQMGRTGPIRLISGALFLLVSAWFSLCDVSGIAQKQTKPIDFNHDVRPILAEHCFACHGADSAARKANLRLDTFAGARVTPSGSAVIVPGDTSNGALLDRVSSSDPLKRMPPPSKGRALTANEIATLKQWIASGAKYPVHWSFVAPTRLALPAVSNSVWVRNPIDRFVLSRLDREHLKPSPEADKYTLIRRVSLDLTGLPPTPQEIEAFVRDTQPGAYERLVDRLLASPHYGERWARRWLDVARYADTNGYEKDRDRVMWPYRDWVIRALNADLPFDQFTQTQLAGDLRNDGRWDSLVATAFHRNTMANEEGGIDIAEDRFKNMIDRVNTTGAAWLGLTVGCAQCHDHKYDSISRREYYGLFAYLNNTDEIDLPVPDASIAMRQEETDRQIAAKTAARAASYPGGTDAMKRDMSAWLESIRPKLADWKIVPPRTVRSQFGATMTVLKDGSVLASGDKPNTDTYTIQLMPSDKPVSAIRLEVLTDDSLPSGGPGRAHFYARGGFLLSEALLSVWYPEGDMRIIKFASASADYEPPGRSAADCLDRKMDSGWMISGRERESHNVVFRLKEPLPPGKYLSMNLILDQYHVHQTTIGRFRVSVTDSNTAAALPMSHEVEQTITANPTDALNDPAVVSAFLDQSPHMAAQNQAIRDLRQRRPDLLGVMALRERDSVNQRVTHMYKRGEFLKPEGAVTPVTPAVLNSPAAGQPKNRLGLAKWLTDRKNPLTARVVMNRDWQAFFGTGIVSTVEDFGTRGAPPSHPELLDYLAVEFMEGGWRTKRMHRLIVTSATYRQASRLTPQLREMDPTNVLLARGPRFRVEAEMVRDIVLASSGQINLKQYGPGIYPPQPAEVTDKVYGGYAYPTTTGPERYRRGLYVYWKRTAPFASLLTFDAPTSEASCVRRLRSNTPLQALTMLNDEVTMEAAGALAMRVMREGGSSDLDRLKYMYLCVLGRPARSHEVDRLTRFVSLQRNRIQADGALAEKLTSGLGAADKPATAVWLLVARAVLNLDEAITKG